MTPLIHAIHNRRVSIRLKTFMYELLAMVTHLGSQKGIDMFKNFHGWISSYGYSFGWLLFWALLFQKIGSKFNEKKLEKLEKQSVKSENVASKQIL